VSPRNYRKERGNRTANLVAPWYRLRGWGQAEARPPSMPGRDLVGMPGLAPEVKARAEFEPLAWLRQARKNAGADLGYVVWRPNGMGPQSIGEWPVMLRHDDFVRLLHQAGYGDPVDDGDVPLDTEGPSRVSSALTVSLHEGIDT
jgi:hypothetical protein